MTKRDELIALDPAGLEAAVRECARITAPEISDVEYERIKADNSPRYQNTRAEMERTLRAYLNAARSQPNVQPALEAPAAGSNFDGYDAVERVALRRTVLDILNSVAPAVENLACNQEQADADGCMVKVSRQAVDEVLAAVNEVAIQAATATGLVAGEAAIRADERERCAGPDLLAVMEKECWTLRCVDIPTGGGDADVAWDVVSHHMAKPHDRVIATGNTPIKALAAAIRAGGE